jgi:hypothetical protein
VGLALDRIHPDPATADFAVSFTLSGDGTASLDLIDVAGRRVAHHDLGPLGRGRHEVTFERDAGVPPGIYSVRLAEAGRSVARTVVLTR